MYLCIDWWHEACTCTLIGGVKHGATILESKLVIFSPLKYIFILSEQVIHFLSVFPKEIFTQVHICTT